MQVGEITEGDQTKEFLITGSRDKSLMIWDIQEKADNDLDKEWGVAKKVMKGICSFRSDSSFFRSLPLRQ